MFMRNYLRCVKQSEFSNSVVELNIVKCKKLDTVFVTIYRPPDTSDEKWCEAMDFIETRLEIAQSHGDYKSVYINGDLNMGNVVWDHKVMCINRTLTYQEELLSIFMNKWNLVNYVTNPTHKHGRILDLVMTNDDELVSDIVHVKNDKISDHDILICSTNIILDKVRKDDFDNYETKVPFMNWRCGTTEQWENYCNELNEIQ